MVDLNVRLYLSSHRAEATILCKREHHLLLTIGKPLNQMQPQWSLEDNLFYVYMHTHTHTHTHTHVSDSLFSLVHTVTFFLHGRTSTDTVITADVHLSVIVGQLYACNDKVILLIRTAGRTRLGGR